MDQPKELLLSCLGVYNPDSRISRFNKLGDDDWNSLLELAAKFNVAPDLYSSLAPFWPVIRIPPQVKLALRNSYHRSAARNMRVYQQLSKLLVMLNAEEIPVILLKGAHLADLVYGNIALRPMGDIDILVRKGDLSRTGSLLIKQGYESSREDVARSLEHLPPFRKKGLLDVEIHFNIAAPPISDHFATEELWERARNEQVKGVPVLTLCPEDLLLHLCLHTTIHHCFDNGIRPFLDIHRTLDHYGDELDSNEAMKRSNRWEVSKSLYVMLRLTSRFLGTTIQAWNLEKIAPENLDFDVIEAAERLVFDQGPPVSFHVARLFAPGSWQNKFRVLMSRAFPPPEAMAVSDSDGINRLSILNLYYFRLKGVISRHWKSILSALLNRKETSEALEAQIGRNRLKDWFENG